MQYRTIFTIFVAVCLFLPRASAQDNGARDLFLQQVLRELSLRNGDVFALELFEGEDAAVSPNVKMDLNVINTYTSSEKLLRAYFPSYEVVQSRTQPKLHFVIRRQTNSVSLYSMEQKLNDFRFEGSPNGLISRIGDAVPYIKTVALQPMPNINKLSLFFVGQKLGVALQAGVVRDVLSACIDFDKTTGIAWVATTRVKDGEQRTEVGYTSDAVFLNVK